MLLMLVDVRCGDCGPGFRTISWGDANTAEQVVTGLGLAEAVDLNSLSRAFIQVWLSLIHLGLEQVGQPQRKHSEPSRTRSSARQKSHDSNTEEAYADRWHPCWVLSASVPQTSRSSAALGPGCESLRIPASKEVRMIAVLFSV